MYCNLLLCSRYVIMSDSFLQRNGIMEEALRWSAGGEPVTSIAFPYTRGERLLNVKYRSLEKKFRQVISAVQMCTIVRRTQHLQMLCPAGRTHVLDCADFSNAPILCPAGDSFDAYARKAHICCCVVTNAGQRR